MKKPLLFILGVRKELSRVKWPQKKYMIKYSLAILSLSIFFSLFLYFINFFAAFIKALVR